MASALLPCLLAACGSTPPTPGPAAAGGKADGEAEMVIADNSLDPNRPGLRFCLKGDELKWDTFCNGDAFTWTRTTCTPGHRHPLLPADVELEDEAQCFESTAKLPGSDRGGMIPTSICKEIAHERDLRFGCNGEPASAVSRTGYLTFGERFLIPRGGYPCTTSGTELRGSLTADTYAGPLAFDSASDEPHVIGFANWTHCGGCLYPGDRPSNDGDLQYVYAGRNKDGRCDVWRFAVEERELDGGSRAERVQLRLNAPGEPRCLRYHDYDDGKLVVGACDAASWFALQAEPDPCGGCRPDQVCVETAFMDGPQFECRTVPTWCSADHGCGCVGTSVCPNSFLCVANSSLNTVSCECLICG